MVKIKIKLLIYSLAGGDETGRERRCLKRLNHCRIVVNFIYAEGGREAMFGRKQRLFCSLLTVLFFTLSLMMLSGCGSSKTETAAEWTLVDPQGVTQSKVIKLNPHPATLEGKTVALRWNGKENGNNFLDEVANQLQANVKDVKVVKVYETMPESVGYSPAAVTPQVVAKIKALHPDIIISSQAD